jgi:hypothetical protein
MARRLSINLWASWSLPGVSRPMVALQKAVAASPVIRASLNPWRSSLISSGRISGVAGFDGSVVVWAGAPGSAQSGTRHPAHRLHQPIKLVPKSSTGCAESEPVQRRDIFNIYRFGLTKNFGLLGGPRQSSADITCLILVNSSKEYMDRSLP